MAEVQLKKKVTLKRKGESVAFTFDGKLKVKLIWGTDTDQDLCLFFKKKDGEVGGVFSNEYRNKKSDLGNLNSFPFMLHMGDNKEPQPGNEEVEQINIAKLDEIDTAYICVVNYGAAIEGEDVTFAQDHARIELQSDSGIKSFSACLSYPNNNNRIYSCSWNWFYSCGYYSVFQRYGTFYHNFCHGLAVPYSCYVFF